MKKKADKGECEHKNLSKERIMGAQTGDKICDDCGVTLTITELKEMEERNKG